MKRSAQLGSGRGSPARPRFAQSLVFALVLALGGCAGGFGSGDSAELEWREGARPVYPAAAKAEGIEGRVTVEYRVTTTGAVEDVRVVEAQPPGTFDAAALTAVRSWKYRPFLRDGVAVPVDGVRSTLEFRLGEAWEGL